MREVPMTYGQESSHSSGFLMGLVCGAAVGAAVGLLLAPKAGSELRQQLVNSTEGWRQKVADTYADASSAVGDAVERGKQKYESVRSGVTTPTSTSASSTVGTSPRPNGIS